MGFRLLDANVVVVARHFNPSIVNQLWLVKNGLVREDEFDGEFAFTNLFAQLTTRDLVMVVTPDQLQLTPRVPAEKQRELLLERVGRFVELLPHTPYVAVGMNFVYHFYPESADINCLTRSIFFVADSPLHCLFDTPDAKFGGYLSKDVLGCRLKLDVKPAFGQLVGEDKPRDFVLASFNFHQDLLTEPDPVKRIKEMLGKWPEASGVSQKIMKAVAERDRT